MIRLLAAGYLLWQGLSYQNETPSLTEEGYETRNHLALVYTIHCLSTSIKHRVPEGVAKVILFHACQLLATSGNHALQLYWKLPPGTPNQLQIIMPRYVLALMANIIKVFMHLLIHFFAMVIVLPPIAYFFRDAHPDQQDGFRAIGVLSVQLFMMFIAPYVFELNHWKCPKEAEEMALLSVQDQCNTPCQLTVTTPLWRRLLAFTFFSEQTTQLETINNGELTQCSLNISSHNACIPTEKPVECRQVKLSCISQCFFNSTQSNDSQTLTVHRQKALNEDYSIDFEYCM